MHKSEAHILGAAQSRRRKAIGVVNRTRRVGWRAFVLAERPALAQPNVHISRRRRGAGYVPQPRHARLRGGPAIRERADRPTARWELARTWVGSVPELVKL